MALVGQEPKKELDGEQKTSMLSPLSLRTVKGRVWIRIANGLTEGFTSPEFSLWPWFLPFGGLYRLLPSFLPFLSLALVSSWLLFGGQARGFKSLVGL